MLQSKDLERLINKEGLIKDSWISQGRGNRLDFKGVLGSDWDGKRRDQVKVKVEYREKEMELGYISGVK